MGLQMVSDDADRGMSLVSIECKPETANIMAGVNAYIGGVMATPDDVNIGSRCGPNTSNCTTRDARLTMQTPSGNIELRSTTDEIDGPAIELTNAQGHTVVRNGVRSNGGGAVKVSGPTGETVGMLRSDLEGNGRMDLGDASGNLMLTMQARKEQGPTLAMLSAWKTLRCSGTGRRRRTESHDRNGVPVISTGIARDRRGGTMAIQNERGVTVIARAVMPADQGNSASRASTVKLDKHSPAPISRRQNPYNRNTPIRVAKRGEQPLLPWSYQHAALAGDQVVMEQRSMSRIRTSPFRLVGGSAINGIDQQRRHLAVANENIAASQLGIELTDPRWTLAAIAYGKLQDGPLTPESREELIEGDSTPGFAHSTPPSSLPLRGIKRDMAGRLNTPNRRFG